MRISRLIILLLSASLALHAQSGISNGATLSNGAALLPGQPCQITTTSLPGGTVGQFYDAFVQTANCVAPLTFSVSSGTFPNWATLNPATGEISGTPNNANANSFTIQVVDSAGHQDFLTAGLSIVTTSGGAPLPPDSALTNWNTSRAATPTSNVTICVGTPANAALLPGGGCSSLQTASAAVLQSVLNAATCGQVINIAPGTFGSGLQTPYLGNFNLPNLQCPNNNWLWITRDLSDTNFPAEGQRVDPCQAGIPQSAMRYELYPGWDTHPNSCARHMPQFNCNLTSGASCFGWTPSGATGAAGSHIRLIGLEITRAQNFDINLALFDFDYQPTGDCALTGSGNTALPVNAVACAADQPNFIICDQCLIHGDAQRQSVIGLKMAGETWFACVDCYGYDVGVTYAGGAGDGHFYGGGTGHGYTGVGHWLFKNTYSESSTMSNEFCGAFCEAKSPATGNDGIPGDIIWTQDIFWKKPLWDPQIGQAYNAAVTIEGQSYGPAPAQEFDVNPSAVSVQQGNQFQLTTVWLNDTFGGLNRAGVGVTPTVDGVANGSSTVGIITKNGEHTVGVAPYISANQVTYTYVACSGVGAPIAACTGATTAGAHTVQITTGTNSNILASQGNSLQLSGSSVVTVTAGAPPAQIAVTPNSPNLSLQPSYSDIYFNVRQFAVTMFAFPNYSPSSISWSVDGIPNGNATVGTIVAVTGSGFSGTSPSEVAYISGTATGNHVITAQGNDGTSGSSTVKVSTNATILGYDLKAFNSKNMWELKCARRALVEKTLSIFSWGGAGNGGGQPGNWFLTQVGNQNSQTTDGTGVNVGYGPQIISDITINYFHAIHAASGMVIAALNAALGVHRILVTNSTCEDCDYTKFMNGFQKRSQVLQISGTASSTKILGWTSAANPLLDNVSVNHIAFFGPVTSQLSIANNNAQFQLGKFTWQNNIVSSTGSLTFINNQGDKNDCNTAAGNGASNTEALALQGAGYVPPKPCFSSYTFSPNVFMDSTASPSVFSSPNISLTPATSVGFVNYSGGNGGDFRLCSGFHTPSILCQAPSPYAAGQSNPASDGSDQGPDAAGQAVYDQAARQGTRTP